MSLKKYLLAGGLSTILILGACDEGTATEEEPAEEEATEESTESGDTASEEESTDASNEAEDRVAELEEQNQELQDQVATLESELESALESSEEVNTEDSNVSEDGSEEVDSEENVDGEALKMYEGGENLTLDTIELSVDAAVVYRAEATEDDEILIMGQDVSAGDELDIIAIQYTVENTSEEPRTFYLDQAEIVTSNGHQLESELLAAEGLNSEMHGAVSNTGTVPYILPDNNGEEIEWIDVIIPWVSDDDWNSLTEEQKIRIEF